MLSALRVIVIGYQNELAVNSYVSDVTHILTQSDELDKKPVEIGVKISEKNELDEIVKSQLEKDLRCVQTDDNFLYKSTFVE